VLAIALLDLLHLLGFVATRRATKRSFIGLFLLFFLPAKVLFGVATGQP
jgi:hypothetical protein